MLWGNGMGEDCSSSLAYKEKGEVLELLERTDLNNISLVDKECFYQRMGFGRKSPDHCHGMALG